MHLLPISSYACSSFKNKRRNPQYTFFTFIYTVFYIHSSELVIIAPSGERSAADLFLVSPPGEACIQHEKRVIARDVIQLQCDNMYI